MKSNPTPVVVVTGIGRGDDIEIRSVLRIESRMAETGQQVPGTIAELMDGARVLARAPLRRMAVLCSCVGCEHDSQSVAGVVQAVLPDVASGTMLRLVRNGEQIWSRQAPSERPVVSHASAELNGDILRMRWQTSASNDNPVERLVRWSADQGGTWQALAINLQEDEAMVSAAMLTTGRALVQVVVSDGFYSVAADPVPVNVPRRAPAVTILWPDAGATVRTDRAMRLWGLATAGDGRTLQFDALRWYLDDNLVGNGADAWIELPEWECEHRVTLRATDIDLQGEASVVFLATTSGRRPHLFQT